MPASNPIVGGRHVSSFASGVGTATVGAGKIASPEGAPGLVAVPFTNNYRVPFVVLMAVALAVLLLLRVWGFRFVVSAGVTGGR